MDSSALLYLSRQDIENLDVSSQEMVDSIQTLCTGREKGWVHVAPKSSIKPDGDHFYMSTLAVAEKLNFMAIKSLGLSNSNADRGLESIGSLITLFDADTGHPIAIMDGNWITAYRTAALSALASLFLARENSQIAAFIGCGVQARSHLDIFCDLYPLKKIYILGRGAENIRRLQLKAKARNLRTIIAEDEATTIAHADLIITTIPAIPEMKPFLNARELKPGSFTSMVDLGRSWISTSFNSFNRIVIDDITQEAHVAQPMVNKKLIVGDLQDLIGKRIVGRTEESERTAFVFRGMAVGDLALAILVYKKALKVGLGLELLR